MLLKMQKFCKFLGDSGGWGLTSALATLVVYLVGLYEHFQGAPITAAILLALTVPLFWIGAYISWSKKNDALIKLEKQLQEVPRIKQVPKSFRCDPRAWTDPAQLTKPGYVDWSKPPIREQICSLVVSFRNDPSFHVDAANAKDVIARTEFFNIDVEQNLRFLFSVYGRWATNPEPEAGASNRDILATDIRIGEQVELDIAVKFLHENDAFAVSNDGYNYPHNLKYTKQQLLGKRFLAVVKLMAVNVKEIFEFRFENEGVDGALKPLV